MYSYTSSSGLKIDVSNSLFTPQNYKGDRENLSYTRIFSDFVKGNSIKK